MGLDPPLNLRRGSQGGVRRASLCCTYVQPKLSALSCYTDGVPTRHPRHTLTETDDVARALRSARELLPDLTDGQRLRRLVAVGAEALSEDAERELRERRRHAQLALIDSGGSENELALILADTLDEPDAA